MAFFGRRGIWVSHTNYKQTASSATIKYGSYRLASEPKQSCVVRGRCLTKRKRRFWYDTKKNTTLFWKPLGWGPGWFAHKPQQRPKAAKPSTALYVAWEEKYAEIVRRLQAETVVYYSRYLFWCVVVESFIWQKTDVSTYVPILNVLVIPKHWSIDLQLLRRDKQSRGLVG